MRDAETTLAIIRERGSKGLYLEDVYRRLYNPDLYLRAYGRIYRNAGATTKGATEETVDGMSMGKIQKIIELLRNERYRWTPVRRVLIPKKNGKTRPLGIPTWSDKLLQEVVRSILDAYYEPQFSPHSHGFRPERGCHSALKDIFHGWTGVKWFIEGDIKGCFDNIDHTVLMSILREQIHDNRFLTLVGNLLEAGYLEQWNYRPTLSGTPQGGIISPLLANVYLDRLDRYVANELIPRFTRGKWKKADPRWHSLQNQIWGRRQKGVPDEELKPMRAEQRALRSRNQFDPGYRRLRYIRYADDFILGFDGPKAEADEIRTLLGTFLREQLKLELSPEKTLITHAETEQARFLGYDISTGMNGGISLRIPPRVLEEKIARYSKGGKPHPRRELTDDTDFSIVATYGLEYRGFVQYYAYARNRFWLHHLQWVMRSSLLKSLAGKHKSSVTKMAERYTAKAITKNGVGTCLMVVIEREGKPPLVAQFGGISLSPEPLQVIEDAPLGRDRIVHHTEIVARLLADECEVCGSKENVQVHHIRKLADLKVGREETPHWKKVMASRKRKTLLVCDYCHKAIHAGRPTRSPDSKG